MNLAMLFAWGTPILAVLMAGIVFLEFTPLGRRIDNKNRGSRVLARGAELRQRKGPKP